jgi:hypothetical protein
MNILVQGTKGGYKVLFPSPTPTEFYQFAADIRRTDSKSDKNFFGKELYSIAFASNGCIFTKYVIVYDTQRGSIGDVGLSVFIPNNQKIAGAEVKTLLDGLAATYYQNYCPDFHLGNKQEDWLLFTSFANQYDSRLQRVDADDIENLQSGSQDAAFVYYSDAAELQRYFDDPYQDEYTPYRQILFVDKALKDKPENPLNALRHSGNDLTGKIDLDNSKYKLLFNEEETGLKIRVSVNGIRKASRNNIRRKSRMEITYSQAYRNSAQVSGTCQEIFARYPQCIAIDEQNRTITIKPVELQKITKSVAIVVTDTYGSQLNHRITCINSSSSNKINKVVTGGQITFEGDEIGNPFHITIDAGDKFKREERDIIPEQIHGTFTIRLKSQKVVYFNVKDEVTGNPIHEFTLAIGGQKEKDNHISFLGNDIYNTWLVQVEANGYKSVEIEISPFKENKHVEVKLKKKPVYGKQGDSGEKGKKYYLKIDEKKGHRTYKGGTILECENNMPSFGVDAKFGYMFVKWGDRVEEKSNGYDGYYEAIFKPLLSLKQSIIIFSALLLIAIATGVWYFMFSPKDTYVKQPTEIEKYIQDDELKLQVMQNLQKDIDGQRPEIKETGGSWLSIFGIGDKAKPDSTEYKEWEAKKQKLDKAIEVRTLIDKGNLCDSVVKNYDYSEQQSKFREAIGKIDSSKCQDVSEQIGDISSLSLDSITIKIELTLLALLK